MRWRVRCWAGARGAVRHRGSHLQIIAAAGSGKTEVVSQRVADLLADGVEPASIVAFTFTERAAAELRHRIAARSEERLGGSILDVLGALFVGTIHSYCFRLLQTRIPRYETYDVLDDHQLTAFLAREASRLDLKRLDPKGRLFGSIDRFLQGLDVIENELLDPGAMPEPFGSVAADYLDTLERYRLLTYGQQIVRAVGELEQPAFRGQVQSELGHLIVDEYQDVNPAQERLIELLAGPAVEVCVVGEVAEAGWVTSLVLDAVEHGCAHCDVAVLVRSRAAYRAIVDHFATFDVPVQPGGRTGLFDKSEALLGRTFAWMTDVEWRTPLTRGITVDEGDLLAEYASVFDLDGAATNRVRRFLRGAVLRADADADPPRRAFGRRPREYRRLGCATRHTARPR